MSYVNKKYEVEQLAEIDNNGMAIAEFPQIRDALARKMMEIYGNDIDMSSASADGQFVNMEALILNNVYRALETIAKNLDPSSASGKYLDVLARFSNTIRETATYSRARVFVAYTGDQTQVTPATLRVIDKNNHTWVWFNPIDYEGNFMVSFYPRKTETVLVNQNGETVAETVLVNQWVSLEFTCMDIGAVKAIGTNKSIEDGYGTLTGDIYQMISANDFVLYQQENAVEGKNTENDASLRKRCGSNFGQGGATVIDNMKAQLLNLPGIKEVHVLNGNDPYIAEDKDSNEVFLHDIYVAISCDKGCALNAYDVGVTIYNALTPGVFTTDVNSSVAINTSYNTTARSSSDLALKNSWKVGKLEIPQTASSTLVVYWKACNEWGPTIDITMQLATSGFKFTAEQELRIKQTLLQYLENLSFESDISAAQLCAVCNSADMRSPISNLPTYIATEAKIAPYGSTTPSSTTYVTNPLVTIRYDENAMPNMWNFVYSGTTCVLQIVNQQL